MADLVSYDRADGSIVDGGCRLRVKEGRLKNSRRKVERILQWQVDGVYGLWRHTPFVTVYRGAEAPDFAVIAKEAASPDIPEDIVGLHFITGVVAPSFRVADADIEGCELGLRFSFRRGSHPGKGIDSFAKRVDDIRNHGLSFGLCLGREVTMGEEFADFIAKQAVDDEDTALPAGALLRCSGERLAEEGEALICQSLWQDGGIGFDDMIGKPIFPCVEWDICDESQLAGESGWLPDDEACLFREPGALEVFVPIEARSLDSEIGCLPGVVGFVNVFVFGKRSVLLGDRVLQFNDARGAGLRIVEPGKLEH